MKELRQKIGKIIHLTRNPNAPDVFTLPQKDNIFGFSLRECPKCGSWEHHKQFYSHWSREHDKEWKLDMIMELIK